MHDISQGRCVNNSHVSHRPFAQRWQLAFNLWVIIIIRETLPVLLEPREVLHRSEVPVYGIQSSASRVSLPSKSFECHWIFISPTLEVCCRLCASLAGYLCDLPHGVFYLFLSSISQMCFSPYFAGLKKHKAESHPGKGFHEFAPYAHCRDWCSLALSKQGWHLVKA